MEEYGVPKTVLLRRLNDREKRALKNQKLDAEKDAWAEKVSYITPILVAAGHTKEGKASSMPQVRNYY